METKRRHKFYALFLSVALMFTMGFGSTAAFATDTPAPVPDETTSVSDEVSPTEPTETKATESIKITKEDRLSSDALYIQKYADQKYVNTDDLSLNAFVNPVTAARGVATYNIDKQKSFDVEEDNYLAGLPYEVAVYDVDPDSDYYVAKPDVNLGDPNIASYNFMLTYNNTEGEMIDGWKYDYNTNLAYIPKNVVDNPQNEHDLVGQAPIAMQLNYYFKNDVNATKEGDAKFSKSILTTVVTKDEVVHEEAKIKSIFDNAVVIDTGVKNAKKIYVMINGMMLPIPDESFNYDGETGILTVNSTPAIIGEITVLAEPNSKAGIVLNKIARKIVPKAEADTRVTAKEMDYFKTTSGKKVTLSGDDIGDLFVGWRGYYAAGGFVYTSNADKLMALKGYGNSLHYLYGGYSNNFYSTAAWAVMSYATGQDKDTGAVLTRDGMVASKNPPRTIYEWMLIATQNFEKARYNPGGNNDLQGMNVFAITFPKSLIGSDTNFVSNSAHNGYNKPNMNLNFDSDEIDETYYLAMGCTHINEQGSASDWNGQNVIYVTCLAIDREENYAVFGFTSANVASGQQQNACGIYKFAIEDAIEIDGTKTAADAAFVNGNSSYSLAGATYGVFTDEACTKRAMTKDGATATLTTTASGKTNKVVVSQGTYWVKELTPSPGYIRDKQVYKVNNENTTINSTETPKYGEVVIQKVDKETGKPVPLGGASFKGAEFTITHSNGQSWNVVTDESGKAKQDKIPLGKVTIKETKAPEGYHLNTETFTANITDNTDADTAKVKVDTVNVTEQVFRGDVSWEKIVARTNNRLPYTPFTIKSLTTGEVHVVIANEEGHVKTAGKPSPPFAKHSQNTNGADSLIDESGNPKVNEAGIVETNEEISLENCGVWFYTDKEGNRATTVVDSLGALPYDRYVINELPFEGNKGYELFKDREFRIKHDSYEVAAGTLTNEEEEPDPEIGTEAKDKKTQSHITKAEKVATIIDTVKYTNLTVGKEYTVSGYPVFKDNGEKIEGVTATATFTPKTKNGEVKLTFTLDSSILAGRTIVFFEGIETEGREVAVHADIEDPEQTIYIPKIKTTATDKASKSHTAKAGTDVTIVDKVEYTNLIPGEDYTVKGELMYKNGKSTKLTAEKTFTAEKADGFVELEFRFNASKIGGSSLVVFETLFDVNGKVVGEHKDPNDPDQTVNYPHIGTTAIDKETGAHVGNAGEKTVIVDTVKYSNLIPGQEYTLEGELMDKETDKTTGAKASTKFTPDKASGEVALEFTIDTSKLKGHTLVAFETLKMGTETVAEHKDIDDEEQSVHIPEVRTTATDKKTGKKEITSGVVVDVVKYKNLIPGKKYTVEGELMDKDGAKATGITAKTEFTPTSASGEVKLEFKIDSKWKNKTLVAYETLKLNGKIVGEHKDINDPEQTVKVGTPSGSNPGSPKTGQSIPWILVGLILVFAAGTAYVVKNRKALLKK